MGALNINKVDPETGSSSKFNFGIRKENPTPKEQPITDIIDEDSNIESEDAIDEQEIIKHLSEDEYEDAGNIEWPTAPKEKKLKNERYLRERINLDLYPDEYKFKVGEISRYMGIPAQDIRNCLNYGIEEFIQPEKNETGLRLFTKEQVLLFENVYNKWKASGKSLQDIILETKSEMGHVVYAPSQLAAAEEMSKLIKEWVDKAEERNKQFYEKMEENSREWLELKLREFTTTTLLEDHSQLEKMDEKIEKEIIHSKELNEQVKRQEETLLKQSESLIELTEISSRQAEELAKQTDIINNLIKQQSSSDEYIKEIREQNELLKEQLNKKKGFFGIFKK